MGGSRGRRKKEAEVEGRRKKRKSQSQKKIPGGILSDRFMEIEKEAETQEEGEAVAQN